jgi:hypothetical protein
MRFNYGATVPWENRLDDGSINAIAGPERLVLRTSAALYGEDLKTVGDFVVEAGQSFPLSSPTEPPLKIRRLRSIVSMRWRTRKRFGVNGAWVAFDRAANELVARAFNESGRRWREIADEIHADVCERGFDRDLNSFVQAYGSKRLDASLLLIPVVGFLPPEDPRVRGTLRAIEDRLLVEGQFVLRYETDHAGDGLPAGEGAFLACSFWLVDNYILQGRYAEASELFARLLARCNDVGLLAEEFDPLIGRMLGNFPQAYSHVGLINCALGLSRQERPAEERADVRRSPGAVSDKI